MESSRVGAEREIIYMIKAVTGKVHVNLLTHRCNDRELSQQSTEDWPILRDTNGGRFTQSFLYGPKGDSMRKLAVTLMLLGTPILFRAQTPRNTWLSLYVLQ